MLAAAGFDDAVISASSDLDEYLIESLKAQDAKINSWGVGTRLITANDNPAFGGVYKLAAVKDADSTEFTPKIKLSENTEKVTNPGNKTVYRLCNKKTGKFPDNIFQSESDCPLSLRTESCGLLFCLLLSFYQAFLHPLSFQILNL